MSDVWLDANVLLRYLTNDPKEHADKAERLLSRAASGDIKLRVPVVVIAEVVWVLNSYYKWEGRNVSRDLIALIAADGLVVEDTDEVAEALDKMTSQNVSFVDAYLAAAARKADAPVASFDRNFRRLDVEWFEPA